MATPSFTPFAVLTPHFGQKLASSSICAPQLLQKTIHQHLYEAKRNGFINLSNIVLQYFFNPSINCTNSNIEIKNHIRVSRKIRRGYWRDSLFCLPVAFPAEPFYCIRVNFWPRLNVCLNFFCKLNGLVVPLFFYKFLNLLWCFP